MIFRFFTLTKATVEEANIGLKNAETTDKRTPSKPTRSATKQNQDSGDDEEPKRKTLKTVVIPIPPQEPFITSKKSPCGPAATSVNQPSAHHSAR